MPVRRAGLFGDLGTKLAGNATFLQSRGRSAAQLKSGSSFFRRRCSEVVEKKKKSGFGNPSFDKGRSKLSAHRLVD